MGGIYAHAAIYTDSNDRCNDLCAAACSIEQYSFHQIHVLMYINNHSDMHGSLSFQGENKLYTCAPNIYPFLLRAHVEMAAAASLAVRVTLIALTVLIEGRRAADDAYTRYVDVSSDVVR